MLLRRASNFCDQGADIKGGRASVCRHFWRLVFCTMYEAVTFYFCSILVYKYTMQSTCTQKGGLMPWVEGATCTRLQESDSFLLRILGLTLQLGCTCDQRLLVSSLVDTFKNLVSGVFTSLIQNLSILCKLRVHNVS
jgi:hypothetical protein